MQEKTLKARAGLPMLILFILLYLAAIALVVVGGVLLDRGVSAWGGVSLGVGIFWILIGFIPLPRTEDYQTPRGLSFDTVRAVHRHAQGTGFLLCPSPFPLR